MQYAYIGCIPRISILHTYCICTFSYMQFWLCTQCLDELKQCSLMVGLFPAIWVVAFGNFYENVVTSCGHLKHSIFNSLKLTRLSLGWDLAPPLVGGHVIAQCSCLRLLYRLSQPNNLSSSEPTESCLSSWNRYFHLVEHSMPWTMLTVPVGDSPSIPWGAPGPALSDGRGKGLSPLLCIVHPHLEHWI